MQKINEILLELFSKFNDLTYYDEPHKYFLGDSELISVTTLLGKYKNKFDSEYWSEIKASEYGMSKDEILHMWDFINKKGTLKGSIIHDYAENLLLNKIFTYPKKKIIDVFGFDPIWEEYVITKKHVDNFIKLSKGRLIPIRTEMVVYDKETMIGGMVDILFYNIREKEFQIWDWKTNKEFTTENRFGNCLKGILFTLPECDFEIYSLQLGLYKYIIEKNINIKLGKSYLVWVSHNNDNFNIIETKNRDYYVKNIVNERLTELAI